jgi:hypothetical protein
MMVGGSVYALFIAQLLILNDILLYSASALLGVGAALIWTGQVISTVLWIRIRTFWLDPNPKEKFGLGFGSRHFCKIKKCEKSQITNT